MPGWVFGALIAALLIGTICAVAWRNTQRQISRTLAKRANLTQTEFLEKMSSDVSPEAARFIWGKAMEQLELYSPKLTPHPDDDLVKDLPLDDEEWSMDWPTVWAETRGFHDSNLPDWPEDWPVTIRNFGRWLDLGPA